MNWTKASAFAEILSSVAILITLIYLAIEIQQSAAATQAEVRQAVVEQDQDFIALYVRSPELHLLGFQEELTDEERTRQSFLLLSHFRMRENNWFQHQNGILDDVTWETYRRSIPSILSAKHTRAWWRNFGVERHFDPNFIAEVNALLEDAYMFEQSPHIAAFGPS
jgi:hypothetical protein